MDYYKHIQLLEKLTAKTSDKSIEWEATAEDNAFQTTVSGIVVRISEESENQYDNEQYRLGLYNLQGDQVESFGHQELIATAIGANPFDLMKSLYQAAQRNAMGADKAIDDVIRGLDELL